jgi:hypothetical protein
MPDKSVILDEVPSKVDAANDCNAGFRVIRSAN